MTLILRKQWTKQACKRNARAAGAKLLQMACVYEYVMYNNFEQECFEPRPIIS